MDRLSDILRQRLQASQQTPAEHPPSEILAAFLERALRDSERERVLAHLGVCSSCREAVSLAAPEVMPEQTQAVGSPLRLVLRSPSALRWASLAAALAVAIGVGMILWPHGPSYSESQGTRERSENMAPIAQDKNKAPEIAAKSENTVVPAAEKKTVAPKTVAKMRSDTPVRATAAREQPQVAHARNGVSEMIEAKKQASAILPSAPTPQPGAEVALPGFSNVQSADALHSRAAAGSTSAGAQGGTYRFSGKETSGSDQRAVQGFSGSAAARSSALPLNMRAKTVPAYGVSSVATATSLRGAIVQWTISSEGRLQRRAQDGALTAVEPASGVGVVLRAIAAEGIEVWAGGSQRDFSNALASRGVLFHSSDAGETWKKVDGPWKSAVTILTLLRRGTLMVRSEEGEWLTTDGGQTWQSVRAPQ